MKLTVLASLLTAASALNASSPQGKKLLANSSRNAEENAASWIVDYSLQFASCHTVTQFNVGENANEDQGSTTQRNLVKYKLCPSNKCGYGCKGAEYVTDMNEFVNAYTEWQMNDLEYKCEQVRENCNCGDDVDEDTCEYNCYVSAGMEEKCVEQEKGDDDGYEFELQEFMECKEIDAQDAYGNPYYVGPKCSSSNQRINLGVFTDEYCTKSYDDGVFTKTYGIKLPYASENLVSEYCIGCQVQDANNNGYYQDPEITEICEESYQNSARCESKLSSSIAYPDNSGCSYINNIKIYEVGYNPASKSAAVGFAVFFGISSAALAAIVFKTHMDSKRTIDLSSMNDAAVV